MKKILVKLGIKCKSSSDSITIFGGKSFIKKNNFLKINSLNDHRIAMSCWY